MSPIDEAARQRYADYTEARQAMLAATDTKHAPWTLVDFNDQKRGRLTLIRDLLYRLPDTRIDEPLPTLTPLGHESFEEEFGGKKPIKPFG